MILSRRISTRPYLSTEQAISCPGTDISRGPTIKYFAMNAATPEHSPITSGRIGLVILPSPQHSTEVRYLFLAMEAMWRDAIAHVSLHLMPVVSRSRQVVEEAVLRLVLSRSKLMLAANLGPVSSADPY
jgi:hypothetical protein